jgi:predicted Rossmann-fold nucleotide-binding protein
MEREAHFVKVVNEAKEAFMKHRNFTTAIEALEHTKKDSPTPQTTSSAYTLAFAGNPFLLREDMRHARLQLEYQKCDMILAENEITDTLVVFGGARIKEPHIAQKEFEKAEIEHKNGTISERDYLIKKRMLEKSRYYEEARQFGRIAGKYQKALGVICTGGGPGIMEAAMRGAHEENAPTVGLNIVLPFEQHPNPYISPEFCFNFHYFSVRKMHFLLRAKALVAFPGIHV